MDGFPLSVGGDGSGASSSKRPQLDLNNVPAAEPESAPPSDLRAVEDENLRLRQENAELQRRLDEEKERIKALLEEIDHHIKKEQEEHQAQQQAWSAYQAELFAEISRLQSLEEKNARMRFLISDLRFQKGKQPFIRFRWEL